MNIIFGTIIDAFSKLREEVGHCDRSGICSMAFSIQFLHSLLYLQKAAAEQQKLNVCYICSVTRQQYEKAGTSQLFEQHQESRHNLADYVRFIYYIRTKNANDLTGLHHGQRHNDPTAF